MAGGTDHGGGSLGPGVAGGTELDGGSLGLGVAGGTELDGGSEGVAVGLGVVLTIVTAAGGVVPRCVAVWCAGRGALVALGEAWLMLLSGSAGAAAAAAAAGDVGAWAVYGDGGARRARVSPAAWAVNELDHYRTVMLAPPVSGEHRSRTGHHREDARSRDGHGRCARPEGAHRLFASAC